MCTCMTKDIIFDVIISFCQKIRPVEGLVTKSWLFHVILAFYLSVLSFLFFVYSTKAIFLKDSFTYINHNVTICHRFLSGLSDRAVQG